MQQQLDSRSPSLIERANRIGVQFLFTDLDTGLTFLRMGLSTCSEEARSRNLTVAHEVYCTVVRLLPRVVPSADEGILLRNIYAEEQKIEA